MTAPPRPQAQDTAREVARARGADFAANYFLAEVEAIQCGRSATRDGHRDPAGFGEAWRRCQELQDESEREYQRKLTQWEADEPHRQASQLAYERAMRQRAGTAVPMRVAAALEWTRPRRLGGGWTR